MRAVAARQPKRHAELSNLREVHCVTLSVNCFSPFVELELSARRRIVSTRGVAFNDESVHLAIRFSQHRGRQCVRGNDGDERWSRERWKIANHERLRREDHGSVTTFVCPGDL